MTTKFLKYIVPLFDIFLKRGILVFFYHSISNGKSRLAVSSEEFEKQIKYLRDNGYSLISPHDMSDKSTNEKRVIICFDDGYKDNLTVAKPILDKYGYRPTVFVATKYISGQNDYVANDADKGQEMMSAEDLSELEKNEWVIANHFHSHRNLIDLTEDEIKKEIDTSREILNRIIKKKDNLNIFSYPRNKVNHKVLEVMKEKKTKMAFGGKRKMIDERDDTLDLPRVEIDGDVDMEKFKLYLSPSFYKLRRMLGK